MWPERTDARIGVQINSYLTLTEDLEFTSQRGVVLVGQVRFVLTVLFVMRACDWSMDVMSLFLKR